MVCALTDNNTRLPILDGMRYVYSKTDDCNFFPRLEITLADPIIIPYLQSAAETAMARYRVFRLVVAQDGEKFYLVDNKQTPKVHLYDGTRHIVGTDENNGHLTWIGASGCRIIIEFFHGVSDIHGSLPFVKLLLQNYCDMRYGEKEALPSDTSSFAFSEDISEYTDSMAFIDENQNQSRKKEVMPAAFQFPDEKSAPGQECYVYSLKVDSQQFDSFMRSNASSRTAVFSLFMNRAIASIRTLGEAPIIASVAADVRKIYGAEASMRDCTDIIPVWYDREIQSLSLPQQLMRSRQMIVDGMQPHIRLASASDIKKNNMLLEKRIPSLEGKKQFCRKIHKYSYSNYTYNISNIGHITFGEKIDSHIVDVHSTMCANTYPVIMEILQYNQQYNIHYSTRLHNDPYVKKFQEMFINEGISCSCENLGIFVETQAVF